MAAPLPHWPALMDAETAGAYVGLCASSFRVLAAKKGVKAVDIGLRAVRYRKADIDRMVDSLPLRDAGSAEEPEAPVIDLAAQALAAVRRSAGR